jgi:predicted RecA/RadA family phage recombinase
MLVFVEDAAEVVAATDVESGESVWVGDRFG